MRDEWNGRQGVDPDGLGLAQGVAATPKGYLTGRSSGEGGDLRQAGPLTPSASGRR